MSTTSIQPFSEDDTYTLLNFAGYGQPEADLWLLTFEQLLPNEVDARGHLNFDQTISKNDAIAETNSDDDLFNTSVLRGQGLILSELMLKLIGKPYNESDIVTYFSDRFLADDGNCFLSPFFPISVDKDTLDDFSVIHPLFTSYQSYLQKVKKLRAEFIQEMLTQFSPKTLIAILDDQEREIVLDVFKQFEFSDHDGIYAGWDTSSVMIVLSPDQLTNEHLDEIVNFINENSLPLDLEKEYGPTKLSQAELDRLAKEDARKKAIAKRKNKAKHDPSDPFCVCDECLKY